MANTRLKSLAAQLMISLPLCGVSDVGDSQGSKVDAKIWKIEWIQPS